MEKNEQEALKYVMNILETEPESGAREQLVVLVDSGKAKEMTGVDLTQDQIKRLSDKDAAKI